MWGRKVLGDDLVVEKIRQGDKEALVYLYENNYSVIRNYILKNSGKEEDVEDVLQEAVIAIWQKVQQPGFELTAKLNTFLYAIAKNLWLKQLNKARRSEPMEDHHENTQAYSVKNTYHGDMKIVVRYMEKLGNTCRKLLHLFYFEEADMKEIAVQLEFANADTAKAKKYQCFKKLEQLVKSHFEKSDFIN
jgi:RNA polymerase sigma factor (sigma-70 family)